MNKKSMSFTGTLRLSAIAFVAALTCVAASAAESSIPPTAEELKNMQIGGKTEVELKLAEELDLRKRAMKEAAQSYGVRAGLLRRTYEIQNSLNQTSHTWDASFNFTPLMLTDFQPGEKADGRSRVVVPPIILELGKTTNLVDETIIRDREAVLKIYENAHFATAVPNWREYLQRKLFETKPALPHVSLLPRTPEERSNWDKWVQESFKVGVAQADAIYEKNVATLERDFRGMVRYHELVDKKVVSLPYVSTRNDGVTGSADQLNINDVTLKITVKPAFQTDSSRWNATGHVNK